jgi:hypothetical protein
VVNIPYNAVQTDHDEVIVVRSQFELSRTDATASIKITVKREGSMEEHAKPETVHHVTLNGCMVTSDRARRWKELWVTRGLIRDEAEVFTPIFQQG